MTEEGNRDPLSKPRSSGLNRLSSSLDRGEPDLGAAAVKDRTACGCHAVLDLLERAARGVYCCGRRRARQTVTAPVRRHGHHRAPIFTEFHQAPSKFRRRSKAAHELVNLSDPPF